MELREFVSKALVDIMEGVGEAQKNTPPGGSISPVGFQSHWKSEEDRLKFRELSTMQIVDFEVTVRTDESSGDEAKLNVVTAIIGGGIKGKSDKSQGHVATLKFKVPVMYPIGRLGRKTNNVKK